MVRQGSFGLLLFGVACGLASIPCTAPIFFSVILHTFVTIDPIMGATTSIVYALGMGLPLVIVSMISVRANRVVIRKISTKLVPIFQKVVGTLLIVAGLYLIYQYYSSITL